MTLWERGKALALRKVPTHGARHYFAKGYLAGWRACGRADRVTKDKEAVVEAAIRWAAIDVQGAALDRATHNLAEAVANLERAKGRK